MQRRLPSRSGRLARRRRAREGRADQRLDPSRRGAGHPVQPFGHDDAIPSLQRVAVQPARGIQHGRERADRLEPGLLARSAACGQSRSRAGGWTLSCLSPPRCWTVCRSPRRSRSAAASGCPTMATSTPTSRRMPWPTLRARSGPGSGSGRGSRESSWADSTKCGRSSPPQVGSKPNMWSTPPGSGHRRSRGWSAPASPRSPSTISTCSCRRSPAPRYPGAARASGIRTTSSTARTRPAGC